MIISTVCMCLVGKKLVYVVRQICLIVGYLIVFYYLACSL